MYTARHRYVSEVARQGGDVKAASVQLGHSDLSMTQNYMVTDGDELAGFAESVSTRLAEERNVGRKNTVRKKAAGTTRKASRKKTTKTKKAAA